MTETAARLSLAAQEQPHSAIWPVPAAICLSFGLFAAHLLRPGLLFPAAACVLWAVFCFFRQALARPVTMAALCFMSLEWLRTTAMLVMLRLHNDLPWLRMSLILAAVALFTLASAALCPAARGRRWFYKIPLAGRSWNLAAFPPSN